MSERSLKVFEGFREGSQKFDYYITTLTGAVFAYVVQNYKPQRLEWNFALLEPISLVLLVLSFYCGLQRISKNVLVMASNAEGLDAAEKAGKTAKAANEITSIAFNEQTGDFVDRETLVKMNQMYQQKRQTAYDELAKFAEASSRYYFARDSFLYAGFVTLFLSKILLPYR